MNIPKVSYLGISFISLPYNQILIFIKNSIEKNEGLKITSINLRMVVKSLYDKKLREILSTFDVIIPDGVFLNRQIKRVYKDYQYDLSEGKDLVTPLFRKYHQSQLNFMLFGGILRDKKNLMLKLQTSFPDIKIIGLYSKRFVKENLEDVRAMVKKGNLGILFVGLSQPEDEKWIFENQDILHNIVTICIDETVEIMAGEKIDVPYRHRINNREFRYHLKKNPLRIFDIFIWIYIWIKTFFFKRKVNKLKKESL